MKKILLLSVLIIFSCSGGDDSTNADCPDQPSLITYEVSEINYDNDTGLVSAVFSGEIQNIQLGANCETFSITNQGFVWSENIQPTISDNVVNVNGQNISVNINNLTDETTYYVRTYLTNILGTFYGNEVSFSTPQSTPVYLDVNGVTVKARDWAAVGDVGTINGVQYTVVDREMLDQMLLDEQDVTKVCTTRITDMERLFMTAYQFNQDISSWDVSNVTNMNWMFGGASSFNQPIGNWDVSNVTDMSRLFQALDFNQDISNWDVSNVTNMKLMFSFNDSFNQPIGNWDTSNVTDMWGMFHSANSFNQPIGNWDVSNVEIMYTMFLAADSFNQPIGNWDVSSVTTMYSMFSNTNSFNQPIGNWDVSSVTNMEIMFGGAAAFNQDIGNWDVSNVIEMERMFQYTNSFNQDIGNWSVENVLSCYNFSLNTPQWTLPKPNFTNCNPGLN